EDRHNRGGLQRVHLERRLDEWVGVLRSRAGTRFAARDPDASRAISELRIPLLVVAVRPGLLVRRLPPEQRDAPADRQEARPNDQHEIQLRDPVSLTRTGRVSRGSHDGIRPSAGAVSLCEPPASPPPGPDPPPPARACSPRTG